jgi:hypothetical protein
MLARTALVILIFVSSAVNAQSDAPPDVTKVASGTEGVASADDWVTVPALTPLYVRIDQEISSKKHKNGDRFPILIAEDVRIGEVVVIPAGSAGEGEVIHAARSNMGGKPGELIVTARFVRVGDLEIRLRSLSLGVKGRDRADESLATSIVTGPFGLFIVGGAMIIPQGTVAGAKTAVEVRLPAVAPTSAPAEQQPVDKPKGGDDENKNE